MIDPPHKKVLLIEIDTAHPQVLVPADSPPTIRVSDAELDEHPHAALELHE
jgi:hypothetical protein